MAAARRPTGVLTFTFTSRSIIRIMQELMTIGEMANQAQVTRRALRHYEQLELLQPVKRTQAGYRLYGADSLRRVAFISRAQLLGLTLAEIAGLLEAQDDPCCGHIHPELSRVVDNKLKAIRSQIAELQELATQLEQVQTQTSQNHCHEVLCVCGIGTGAPS